MNTNTESMSTEIASSDQTKVPITLGRGLLAALVYFVVVVGAQLISGVDYDKFTESLSDVFGFIVVPVGLASFAVLALTARWGWWQPVFVERDRLSTPRWLWIIPFLILMQIFSGLATSPWGDWDGSAVMAVLLGTLMVGFGEELVFRGYLLVGARAKYSETGAWFISSALFGLIHGANLISGQDLPSTIKQMASGFVLGGALYIVRRLTGLLVVGMVLHGLWDFSAVIKAGPGQASGVNHATNDLDKLASLPASLALAVTVIALIVIFRPKHKEHKEHKE